ncbi:hypothetical protein [Teredinibacter sp. KSP-S5-2]|uniref:hypothetical protein n=1 Tax=Teredinibacter sp. KSP-S5-2 TaxID=3034506 RepID=UPI0029344B55|nr:hypothetical protein [Teredinibacter sp. KSP-S5-2]WNO08691.1 hypothetical protein P5V12_17100 [Teredinibacter sp. KSP-S5-2]
MTPRPFAPALPHGEIRQVMENTYFVTGTFSMSGPVTFRFSRNMVVLRNGEELTLVNTVRLNDEGLQQLDTLGQVKHIIRLAGFHGMDDPFYKERYGAKVWSVNAPYAKGTSTRPKEDDIYFSPDEYLTAETELPVANAKIIELNSQPPELLLYLDSAGGTIVAGDCLQHWHKTDEYFNFAAKAFMHLMGFIKPYNIGPGWLKFAKPDREQLKAALSVKFNNVLPAHGDPVLGNADKLYQPVIHGL